MFLGVCPVIPYLSGDFSPCGISYWRDLMQTTAQLMSMLGISPSAYDDALDTLG